MQEQAVQLAEQIEQIDKVLTELESASGISEDNGFVIQKILCRKRPGRM